ncbi:hypothetical protein [Haloactinomyces albus]|uniref:3-hydroxyisobutyrate dehydrogenase-like beta-hydroxyacid dehydrogenase n=1 Tax=Haloactinomyces albus TaxID=1352928 RepID=A0AAE4CNI9_9ACTN|nr:hypothetical protein [Haloactinomyces albus]MDR7303521.1 3-hydroxyisobutyrate dehydrogenase-like beta-hydroxyacid dehydrogenase [Haloactinomyces albus]
MSRRVSVFGAGSIGSAVAHRLSECGVHVALADRDEAQQVVRYPAELIVLALTHGLEVPTLLDELPAESTVVDLTTQSSESALRCCERAVLRDLEYHGGGLTGGADQVNRGEAVLLLGPPLGNTDPLLALLGQVISFDDVRQAARAKIIHNAYLLLQQTLLTYFGEGGVGLEAEQVLTVLETGTAGRSLGDSSVVRDLRSGAPSSSYRARLALKDIAEIRQELPGLPSPARHIMDTLKDMLETVDPQSPFTTALIENFYDR